MGAELRLGGWYRLQSKTQPPCLQAEGDRLASLQCELWCEGSFNEEYWMVPCFDTVGRLENNSRVRLREAER
ncbi:MAG: hypothetical protein EB072_00100 [Betaproteobacteria bacterium]|nr:hypothetical protein [Betaproteobacteria bacterium]